MGREVVGGKAAEHIRHFDHGGDAGSEAGQSVEDASQRGPGRLGQVGVDGRGGDVGVAEQDLHDPGVDAIFEQPRRIAMAQRVRGDRLRNVRGMDGGPEGAAQHVRAERVGAVAVGEQPARRFCCKP